MKNLPNYCQKLINQFNDFVNNGGIPLIEVQHLTIEFNVTTFNDKYGLLFSFDTRDKPVSTDLSTFYFQVERINDNTFFIAFEECFDDLGIYLQDAHEFVVEKYLFFNRNN